MMKRRVAVLLMLGTMPWAALHAQQTASTTFRVQARVEAACKVTASGLNVGTRTLRATCTPDSIYKITTSTDAVTGVGTGLAQDHTVAADGNAGTISIRIYY